MNDNQSQTIIGNLQVTYTKLKDITLNKKIVTDVINETQIDTELNKDSENPIQNQVVSKEIGELQDRLRKLEYITNNKLAYITNLEVFPTKNRINAGEQSEKVARIDRLFSQTNEWQQTKTYPAGTIVTVYDVDDTNASNKIYRAIYNIEANTELTAKVNPDDPDNTETYWEDITDDYIQKHEIVVGQDENGDDIKEEKYFHHFIEDVDASTIQVLKFKSIYKPTEQNVKIEWGDGSTSHLASAKENVQYNNSTVLVEYDENGYIYTCYHDYTDSLGESSSKYYMIKIIGNKYSSLTSDENNNIISGIFGDNMSFYLDCIDVEGLCKGSKKLLYVSCSDYDNAVLCLRNVKSLFENCINLQYAMGFYEITGINTMLSMERMFAGCTNMLNCDCRIAKSLAVNDEDTGNKEVFLNCENMSSRLRALLPTNGFDSRIITLDSTFKNCKNIYVNTSNISPKYEGGEPLDIEHIQNILFNDTSKIFIVNKTFESCMLLNNDIDIPAEWR